MTKCTNINADILKWARESAGFSVEELAPSFKKLAAWESREECPTYVQLENLAKRYKRPVAIFFFPGIPREEGVETSFRTLPLVRQSIIPPSVRFMIREGKLFQINLAELYKGKNPFQEQLITKQFRGRLGDSLPEFAKKIRAFLGVGLEEQKSWNSPAMALKKWRERLNGKGVFVFKNAFKSEDYSGFCLYDSTFPIVYINNSFPETRQIFTLFHELAHLLFQENHLAWDNDNFDFLADNDKRIEMFCNRFASEFLVPCDDFEREMGRLSSRNNVLEAVSLLADKYTVSREVILRKYLDKGKIDRSTYKKYASRFQSQSAKRKGGRESAGDYYNTKMAYLGKPYMDAVFAKYLNGQISSSQASDYLRINEKSLERLESRHFGH